MQVQSYDLDLDVDFRTATVSGMDIITLSGADGTLSLDASAMSINAVKVNGKEAPFDHDAKKGVLRVDGVHQSRSRVTVCFTKKVPDDVIFGLYKSKYGKKYSLATDFEPAGARTAFPCVDNPAYKAVFNLAITTKRGLKVIFNTSLRSRKAAGRGRVRHVFHQTPKMSTYLLFFAIGDFDEIRTKSGNKEVIVATRPKESKKGRFVLQIAKETLKDYQRYFGIAYPLKKLHIVGLPEYHASAMENWGAISSREGYVLLDKNSSVHDLRYSATVMVHEIAHQWFGDLVTMKWWDDLWLNESFAALMQFKMTDRLHPDWDAWGMFLTREMFQSQNFDALSSTHPIQVHVKSPAESRQTFDAVSYGKGASVLRMVESYMGEAAFRKGVSAYLRKFSYSNATGEDLWKSLDKASGQPVSKIMAAWITKPGFPLVRVSYGDGMLTLRQRRFLLSGEEPEETWPIPLTLEINGERKSVLFERRELSIAVSKLSSLNVNIGHSGFYSVLADKNIYDLIASKFEEFPANDKAGLLSDLYLFLQAGKVPVKTYFRFVSLCSAATDSLLVETLAQQLTVIYSICDESKLVRDAVVKFATSQLARLGLEAKENEDKRESVAREAVLTLLARLDTEHTATLASMFPRFGKLDPNLRQAVAIAYARETGDEAYETFARMVKSMSSEVDRDKVYMGMTSFKDGLLVQKALDLGISGEVSRSDSGPIFIYSALNPSSREAVWEWVRKRYDKLWELYTGSQKMLQYMEAVMPSVAVGRSAEVRNFLAGEKMKKGGMAYRRLLEALEIRTELREKLLAAG